MMTILRRTQIVCFTLKRDSVIMYLWSIIKIHSGTTAEVANKFGRKAVLIELNADYCELQMKRNRQKTLYAAVE